MNSVTSDPTASNTSDRSPTDAGHPELASALGQLGAAWWWLHIPTGTIVTSTNCGDVLGAGAGVELDAERLAELRPFPPVEWRTLETVHGTAAGRIRSRLAATRDANGALLEVFGLELPFAPEASGAVPIERGAPPAGIDGIADEQLLRDVLALQPAMCERFTLDGRILWCNDAYAEHLGLTTAEAVGRRWPDMVAELAFESSEFVEALLVQIVEATAGGGTHSMVSPAHETGGTRWIQWTNRRIRDGRTGDEFIQGVGIEVTELRATRDALDEMTRELVRARVRERRELAHRLHDDVVQVLVSALWAVSPAESGAGVDGPTATRAADLVRSAIEQLRTCLAELTAPAVLPGLLADAVHAEARALRQDGIRVQVMLEELTDEELRTVCTRVLVEAMRNVSRHAQATDVSVALRTADGCVIGEITDNGVGAGEDDLTRALAQGHVGLLMSRALVESLGGRFEVGRTSRSSGTTVRFSVPVGAGSTVEPR